VSLEMQKKKSKIEKTFKKRENAKKRRKTLYCNCFKRNRLRSLRKCP
jgi:hypothetical protein